MRPFSTEWNLPSKKPIFFNVLTMSGFHRNAIRGFCHWPFWNWPQSIPAAMFIFTVVNKKQHISQHLCNHDAVKPPTEMAAWQPIWISFRSASLFFSPASALTWIHINTIKCLQIHIMKKQTIQSNSVCDYCVLLPQGCWKWFNVAVKPAFAAGKRRNLEDRHINF